MNDNDIFARPWLICLVAVLTAAGGALVSTSATAATTARQAKVKKLRRHKVAVQTAKVQSADIGQPISSATAADAHDPAFDDVTSAKLVAGTGGNSQGYEPAAVLPPEDTSASAAPATATTPATTATVTAAATAATGTAAVTNRLPENQIPVLTSVKEEKKSEGGQWHRVLITLGVLAILFGVISFGLKYLMSRKGKNEWNNRIRVLTQHHLGPKKSLYIVQVAGESILLGVTDHNISMLKTLALIDDEIPEKASQSFGRELTELDQFDEQEFDGGSVPFDDFAIRGISEIRDTVSKRLKSMRKLT